MSLLCARCGVDPQTKDGAPYCSRTCRHSPSVQHNSAIRAEGAARAKIIAAAPALPLPSGTSMALNTQNLSTATADLSDEEEGQELGEFDRPQEPLDLGNAKVLPRDPSGLALHLFPTNVTPTNFVGRQRLCPLTKNQREFRDVERALRLSMMKARRHLSMAVHPFCKFHIVEMMRIEDPVRWNLCQQLPQSKEKTKWIYCLHGTSNFAARRIVEEGFKISPKGDYGPGVYLAQVSTGAHLFAMNKVICPVCVTDSSPPTFMGFDRTLTTPDVQCASCARQDIGKSMFHECSICENNICRTCGDRCVNGDGFCDMLLCLVNVGEMKSVTRDTYDCSSLQYDTLEIDNNRGWCEVKVLDPCRVYPIYWIRYSTDLALAARQS